MAAISESPPGPPILTPPKSDTNMLNTLHDPSTPSTSSIISRNDSATSELDLNDEVSKLTEKLINSINHQTSLDEALQATRHELEQSRREVDRLTAQTKEHAKKLETGSLISKEDHEGRLKALESDITTQRHQQISRLQQEKDAAIKIEREMRIKAELDRKNLEQEIETLTSALFEEANTMVANERREREAAEKKIDHQNAKINDLELLLQVQQAQLHDLKATMEKMASETIDDESQAPSSPNTPTRLSRALDSTTYQTPTNPNEHTPENPLHYSYLIQPIFRTDVQAYEDFRAVLKAARVASPPASRVSSGSFGSLGAIAQNATSTQQSLPPLPPRTGSPRSSVSMPPLPLLRDTKMFKRVLVEDIEPTLRLDIAPGVSWMTRRYVLGALIDGSMVVEPTPTPPVKFRGPVNACALCGENRVGDLYARKHRFRISEEREKKPFPLCDLCLARLRSCGDLLSFMRMVSNGHYRADRDEEVLAVWEEFIRLKEKMFWHRISAGVVPVLQQTTTVTTRHSRNASRESIPSKQD